MEQPWMARYKHIDASPGFLPLACSGKIKGATRTLFSYHRHASDNPSLALLPFCPFACLLCLLS
jgi:hypothetical protein